MSKEIEEKRASEWCDLGFELGKEGKFQEAIEYLEKAIKLEPNYEKAIKIFEECLKNDIEDKWEDNQAYDLKELGEVYKKKGIMKKQLNIWINRLNYLRN